LLKTMKERLFNSHVQMMKVPLEIGKYCALQ